MIGTADSILPLYLSDPIEKIEPIIQSFYINFIDWSTWTELRILIGTLIWTGYSRTCINFLNHYKILKQVRFQKTLNLHPYRYLVNILHQYSVLESFMIHSGQNSTPLFYVNDLDKPYTVPSFFFRHFMLVFFW